MKSKDYRRWKFWKRHNEIRCEREVFIQRIVQFWKLKTKSKRHWKSAHTHTHTHTHTHSYIYIYIYIYIMPLTLLFYIPHTHTYTHTLTHTHTHTHKSWKQHPIKQHSTKSSRMTTYIQSHKHSELDEQDKLGTAGEIRINS